MWAVVDGKSLIARHDLTSDEAGQPKHIDGHFLTPTQIKKICVDLQGQHCLFLQDLEIFAASWNSNEIISINDLVTADGSSGKFLTGARPQTISAIDIHVEPGQDEVFEVVFGTEAGGIYHAAFFAQDGKLEMLEKFEMVLELPEARAILDLKVAQLGDSCIVLAVTDSCLY